MENNALSSIAGAISESTKVDRAISSLSKLININKTEVFLPILKTKATVNPLTGSDVLLQKTLKASGYKFIKLFNELLFNNTTFDDVGFENVEDFEKHLTTPDKNVLIYALLNSTYTTLPEKLITCPHCKKQDEYVLKPSDMIQSDTFSKPWEHEEDIYEYEKVKEIVPGFSVVYSMQTENRKLDILKTKRTSELQENVQEDGSLLNNIELVALYIKRLEIADEEEDGKLIIEETTKILEVLQNVPPELKIQLINMDELEEFFKYNPNFYVKLICRNKECNKEFNWFDVNPELDFFRKSVSIY